MKNKIILVIIATFMLAISAASQLNAQQPATPTPAATETDSAKTNHSADAGKTDSLLDFSSFNFNYHFTQSSDAQSSTPDKTITIGTQTWMAENLNVSTFRNGDPIPEVTTPEEWVTAGKERKPAWCYYNNDPANEKKYGKLYNWYALIDQRGLAPDGWHVPSEAEWNLLLSYLGKDAGRKLRTVSDWKSANDNGTNETGFAALPGSCRANDGDFLQNNSSNGYWWSSTEFLSTNAGYGFNIEYYGAVSKHLYNYDGLSVRCIKD